MIATMTSKGQLTLPKPIRDHLRLHAGDKLDFILGDDDRIEMVPKKTPIRQLKGMRPPPVRGVSLKTMEKAIAKGAVGHDRD